MQNWKLPFLWFSLLPYFQKLNNNFIFSCGINLYEIDNLLLDKLALKLVMVFWDMYVMQFVGMYMFKILVIFLMMVFDVYQKFSQRYSGIIFYYVYFQHSGACLFLTSNKLLFWIS